MKQNSSSTAKRIVLTILSISLIIFIFYNSLFDGDDSSDRSLGVLDFINNTLQSVGIGLTVSHHFVRKAAHFTEFFVLGTLLFFTVRAYITKTDKKILFAPLIGLVVASTDETIQLFVPGRAGMITDVLLDFSGVCTAVLVFYLFFKKFFKKS